jgi:methionyl-tRNA formyltransferase
MKKYFMKNKTKFNLNSYCNICNWNRSSSNCIHYKKIKLVLFFNNFRGIEVLKTLVKENYEVKKIFLSKKNLNKDVITFLKKKFFKFIVTKNVNSKKIISYVQKNKIDFNIIAGFPYIFKKNLLDAAKHGTLNLHAGRLPYFKGGSPLNWQIINGEKKIGISIIKANEKIDKGIILNKSEFVLKKNYDISDVHRIANIRFSKLISKTLKEFIKDKIIFSKNIGGKVYKQRSFSDGLIKWNKMSKENVYNLVRAITYPYPGAFTYLKDSKKKIIILKCKPYQCSKKYKSGFVFFRNNSFFVKCKDGCVKLLKFEGNIKSGDALI